MSVLPDVSRPKAVSLALAEVEHANDRVYEVERRLLEAREWQAEKQREANGVFVGDQTTPGRVSQGRWDALQAAAHQAEVDARLADQVRATAAQEAEVSLERLASVVMDNFDRWRTQLEKRWEQLDGQAVEQLAQLRETELERATLVGAHRWLIASTEGDILGHCAEVAPLAGSPAPWHIGGRSFVGALASNSRNSSCSTRSAS